MDFWNKLLQQIEFKAATLLDRQTQMLVRHIRDVNTTTQKALLSEYLLKCGELYSIAFFQWRNKFPNKLTYSENEQENLIIDKYNSLYGKVE